MSDRRPLGDILKELGRVTESDVTRALEYQREHGGFFGQALVAMGVVKQEELEWTLASQFDLPYVFPNAEMVDPDAATLVTPDWALRHTALPIARSGDSVTLLVDSPLQEELAAELERTAGVDVELALASGPTIRGVIREVFAAVRRRREGLTSSDAVTLEELWKLVADSGAERWGVSVREDRALGWYDHGSAIRRYQLRAGWNRELENALSPSLSERLPGLGEGRWVARLEQGGDAVLVEVHVLSTPEGRELLFTHREPFTERDEPPPLPRALLDELRLLLEEGDVVVALRATPAAEGRKLLPHLPEMLLPAGHRSLHLAPEGDSLRIPGVLVLPVEGSDRAGERRIRELKEFRFDAVTAEVPAEGGFPWDAAADLAPTAFFLVPAPEASEGDSMGEREVAAEGGSGVGELPPRVDWALDLRWSERDGRWSWQLVPAGG